MAYNLHKSAIKRLNAYNMNKQTAVEWLYERFLFAGYAVPAEWKEKAKEMEKQQIINANRDGVDMVVDNKNFITGEQYYNETYGDDT
jgi:hypothetical protein